MLVYYVNPTARNIIYWLENSACYKATVFVDHSLHTLLAQQRINVFMF